MTSCLLSRTFKHGVILNGKNLPLETKLSKFFSLLSGYNFILIFFSWQEVWKLRYLSKLQTLILSGNPLLDLFFQDHDLDPNCACFCHHDDNELAGDDNTNTDSCETDINDVTVAVLDTGETNFDWIQTQDKNGNESSEDEVIEGWCQKILDEVISELIQERYSALKNQNYRNSDENDKNNEKTNIEFCPKAGKDAAKCDTVQNINNRSRNTRNKLENLMAGSYFCMTSHIEESNKRNNSESSDKRSNSESSDRRTNSESSQCECFCNRDDLPNSGFSFLETLCVSETNIGKWKHLTALNAFPSLKSLRIKVYLSLNNIFLTINHIHIHVQSNLVTSIKGPPVLSSYLFKVP